ncbi:Class V chitinase, partial [Linum perenne]
SSINPIIFEKVSKFTKFHSAKFHFTHFFPRISLYKSHQFFSFFFPIQFIPCFSLTLFFFSKMAISKQLIPFFSAAAVFLLLLHSTAAQPAVVRGGYWFPDSGFAVSAIESRHFTHLFCAFAGIDSGNFQLTVPAANRQQFMTFTQTVQSKNPSVRTLLSIGGGGANVATFAAMASQPGRRKSFIDTSISTARSFNFHGLDLDWEYPSDATQMANFGSLLTEWRAAVAAEARTSGKPPLLLSAAVLYLPYYYSNAVPYPVRTISNSLDWINLMAYDFFGPGWTPTTTGPPAALFNPGRRESGDNAINLWIQAGLGAKKIVLGMPFYGWSWQLNDAGNHGLYSPANGKALQGEGSATYSQINAFIRQNRATKVYNSTVVSDYCYSGRTWIGYDDVQSVSTKVAYAKRRGLLGYFAWHVGADDNWTLSSRASQAWGA